MRGPAVKVAIPNIQSWLQQQNLGKTSGTSATAVRIATPNIQSPHVRSDPVRAPISSGRLATSDQIATPDIKTSYVHPSTAKATKFSATAATEEQIVNSKIQNSHVMAKVTKYCGLPATAVRIANSDAQSSHKNPNTAKATASSGPAATAVQIANLKNQNSNANSNASPDETQTTNSKNKAGQVQNSTRKMQKESSRPNIRTTEIFTEVTTLREASDVPSIDMTRKLQKQSSAVSKDGDKVKAPVSIPEGRMEGTSELAARSHDAREDSTPEVQNPDPPKTLSKAGRKKQNKKQREADQKERKRKEAAEIEAAIASNREQVEKMEQMAAAVTLLSVSTTEKLFRKLATNGKNVKDKGGEFVFSSA